MISRRNILIGAGALVVLLVLSAAAYFLLLGRSVSYASGTMLTIVAGDVSVQQTGQLNYQPGRDGMTLQAGDFVKTTPNGFAVITFFDGSTASLDPGTEVGISSLLRNRPGQASAIAIALQQKSGAMWTRIAPMASQSSLFQIDTPASVVVVRGTLLLTEVAENGATTVRCYEGTAQVRAVNTEVEAAQFTRVVTQPGQPPQPATPQPAPPQRLVITTSPQVWARVLDLSGRTTGFVYPGVPISQIPESISGLSAGPERRFEVPVTRSGEFTIVLEGALDGEYQIVVQGLSDTATVFTQPLGGPVRPGQRFVSKINLTMQSGRLTGGQLGAFSVLPKDQVVGKYVVEQAAVDGVPATATAVAIKGTSTAVVTRTATPPATETATAQATVTATATQSAATATRTAPTAAPTQPPAVATNTPVAPAATATLAAPTVAPTQPATVPPATPAPPPPPTIGVPTQAPATQPAQPTAPPAQGGPRAP